MHLTDLINDIDKKTLDIGGAVKDTTKASNEFFKKRPTARDVAEKIAVATTVAAPGGIVIGPAIMHVVNKKKAKKMEKTIKQKIKSGMDSIKKNFVGG